MNKVSEKEIFILFILLQSVLIFIALLLVILNLHIFCEKKSFTEIAASEKNRRVRALLIS